MQKQFLLSWLWFVFYPPETTRPWWLIGWHLSFPEIIRHQNACLLPTNKPPFPSRHFCQDVDQLVDPFSTLFFLRSHGVLHADFLRALCQWSLKGVHRPNVRSERRPTSQQLVILHDFCFERLGPDFRRFVMRIIRAKKREGFGYWSLSHCFLFARITFNDKIFRGVKEFFCFATDH